MWLVTYLLGSCMGVFAFICLYAYGSKRANARKKINSWICLKEYLWGCQWGGMFMCIEPFAFPDQGRHNNKYRWWHQGLMEPRKVSF